MPNNYLLVLYKHIIQVENKNVGLKMGERGAQTYHCPPPSKMWGGGHMPPLPPRFLRQCYIITCNVLYVCVCVKTFKIKTSNTSFIFIIFSVCG